MRKFLSLLLALCLVVGMLPLAALAADGDTALSEANTMTLKGFIDKLKELNNAAEEGGEISFDGEGVTVKWKPNEKVTDNDSVVIQRVQEPNAQYQLLSKVDKSLTISNVHFEYVPADIPDHSDAWNTGENTWTKEQIRNAEFQFLNTGNVTIENCTFEKVIVSPYGPGDVVGTNGGRSFIVQGCTFRNVYNAYALKDIYPAAATITGNTFNDCSGAIYFEGSVPRQVVTITDNTFNGIDQYAAPGKENTRSIIQFSTKCVLTGGTTGGTTLTISGNTIEGNLVNDGKNNGQLSVIRQICNMGEVTIEGWTPGKPFCVKIEADSTLTLPNMPSDQVDGITYTFVGWAESTYYKGPTDLTNRDNFLTANISAPAEVSTFDTKYYAVWDATKTTVSGEKVWVDDGHVSNRPASIKVQLLANENPVSPPKTETVSANDSGEWVFSFDDLPAFDANGEKIEYTVTEREVPDNYTSSVTNNGNGFFTITNTYKEPVAPPPYNPGGSTQPPELETDDHIQYLFGYPDRSFQPEANMTRAEAAQMFHNLLEKKSYEITTNFSDVSASSWYTTAVNTMGSLGVVSGYGDGTFRPNKPITRAEFVSMAVKFLESPQASTENKFSDVSVEDWFWNAVQAAVEEGWISGYEDGSFRPNRNITRAEVASIVNHVLERVADPDYVRNNKEKLNDFIDVTPSHWAYYHIVEATNWHNYTKHHDGKEYTETWSSSSFELR